MNPRFVKPSASGGSKPTSHLYVCGLGDALGTALSDIKAIFEPFGELDEDGQEWGSVDSPEGKRYVFVSFKSPESAEAAYTSMVNQPVPALNCSRLLIRYAERAPEGAKLKGVLEQAEDVSVTRDVVVPGLVLIEDFISESKEKELWDHFNHESAPWEESLSRRVQHYGIPFNYRTLMLDYNRKVNPFPAVLDDVTCRMVDVANNRRDKAEREGDENVVKRSPDMPTFTLGQLTVNEYEPGQGIAAHIDTYNCFGPEILVISMGSPVTMNMQNRETGQRKAVLLPARSLLLLSGPARYEWSHAIPSRLKDKVDGVILERTRRISLTFREALLPNEQAESLAASSVEVDHVFRVYDNIAVHWNHTRGKRKVHWNRVKSFLEELPAGSLLADVGSGDGKYFGLNPNVTCIGCDRSWNLLRVSKEPNHETFCCDIVKLPFRDDIFDATICVAVLHHLANKDRRIAAVRELVRITRPGGKIMVQAWAKEQEENSRLTFDEQDVLVPWKMQQRFFDAEKNSSNSNNGATGGAASGSGSGPGSIPGADAILPDELVSPEGPCKHVTEDSQGALVFQRYCHVYRDGELQDLCSSVPGASVSDCGWDRGNWFVEITKEASTLMDLPVNPQQFSYPAFLTRQRGAGVGDGQIEDGGIHCNGNPNAHMGKGNDESFASLKVVQPNNRAKKDVGNKKRHIALAGKEKQELGGDGGKRGMAPTPP